MEEIPTIIELENATAQVRLYPSDAKYFAEQARLRRTTTAQIIHELREKLLELK